MIPKMPLVAFALAAAVTAGCGSPKLQYEPEPFVGEAKLLSADYTMLAEKLMVEVYTDGYRIDQIWIETADGGKVEASQIEYQTGGGGSGFGVGIGGGSGGVGGGVGVGTSTGRGHITGNTKVFFERADVGAAPWRLHLKLMGLQRTVIVLPERAG